MADFSRDEVEAAFINYWVTGCIRENWEAWVDLFVDDVEYVDHWWGPLHGKEEVKVWIAASMGGVPEMYTPLDWYVIEGEKIVFHMENRRDNPDPEGPPYFDFPGVSTLWYAGDGKFAAGRGLLGPVRRAANVGGVRAGVPEDGHHRSGRPHVAEALAVDTGVGEPEPG